MILFLILSPLIVGWGIYLFKVIPFCESKGFVSESFWSHDRFLDKTGFYIEHSENKYFNYGRAAQVLQVLTIIVVIIIWIV
ncbi:hypothetical protein DV872_24815 [Oceanispirochaeta sp. M1]|nr:hypothetical protein DV872_24815 [Oceanispirochaeta sp. M1]